MAAITLAVAVFLAMISVAHARECTTKEAMAAEDTAANLAKWRDIYAAYRRYAHCDDGAIAEGFSDSVVHVLATNWESLPELAAIVQKNAKFRRFVLRHVDASTDVGERKLIAEFSLSKCPPKQSKLCGALRTEALRRD